MLTMIVDLFIIYFKTFINTYLTFSRRKTIKYFRGEIEKSYKTFYSAQKVGRSKKSCKAYSAECPVSIFNFPSAFKSFIP